MQMMVGRRKLKSNTASIECPIDLDSLILSDGCSPEFLETNLNVNEDILHDAIMWSDCAGWLLKLDVFEKFSADLRYAIFNCLAAFSLMNRVYFILQLQHSGKDGIIGEFADWSVNHVLPDKNIQLLNPLSMLGNDVKGQDIEILQGRLTLRRFLLDNIGNFLKTGNKGDVDFSYSLFLPELLNPRFFKDIGEGEQIVILGNMDKYFQFTSKFTRKTGLSAIHAKNELNIPQALLKHVLSGDCPYTNRVKMMAWKQLFKEIGNLYNNFTTKTGVFKVVSAEEVNKLVIGLNANELVPKGESFEHLDKWLTEAEGVFEAFELDCTLHNLNASDYFIPILCDKGFYKMAEGLINFQDDSTRDKLFKQLSSVMMTRRS